MGAPVGANAESFQPREPCVRVGMGTVEPPSPISHTLGSVAAATPPLPAVTGFVAG
jgi:hypothetical protein